MAISFTPQQKKVIEARDCNVLVSAAAGSGKTAVLVERIIRLICDEENPIDVDKLLVVTFTNAAAAQMRERIGKAIEQKLAENPMNEHLQRQAALLHNAQITTIHSFCLFVIRNHFHTIGLDPSFRVADEGELELMKQDIMKTLMESRFASKEEEFHRCVEYFCLNEKETVLEENIFKFYTFAMSYPWPESWLLERKKDYESETKEEFSATKTGKYFLSLLQKRSRDLYELLGQGLKICDLPDGPYMYGECISLEVEALEKLMNSDTIEEFEQRVSGITFRTLPPKKDDSVDGNKREAVKELRNEVKDGVKEIIEQYFGFPYETAIQRQKVCREMISILTDLTLEFKQLFDQEKREKKILDFHDIEHFALKILLTETDLGIEVTEAAKEYRKYFKEILIDEYQDSNLVQEYILKAVSGEETQCFNRFMVGDVKQSIYRFRLAKPSLFLEKYKSYEHEKGKLRRIDLSTNFRSREEVLSSVNTVFEKIMTEAVGGIVYDDHAALHKGAEYRENIGNASELIFIEKPSKEDQISAKEAEALAIAQKIKELKSNFCVTDDETGNLRPIEYRDIVILLRSNSGWDEEFKKVLQEKGIPAYISSKTGYFSTSEIQNILFLLKVLDNPLQDIPFYGVMKSSFGGFSEEEIALLRGEEKKDSLYQCVKNHAHENEKCKDLLRKILNYREKSVYLPISKLLQEIMSDYEYIPYVSALPYGEQRKANVEMFLEKAVAFEATSFHGLFHFIRYIEKLKNYDIDYGEANILDENANVVRIMSIHKSKGLEFPVTFVAALGKMFNNQDIRKPFLIDDELGIGIHYVDLEQRIKSKSLRRNILAEKIHGDDLAEELRILYVAMTRAKEKLIMTGTISKMEEKYEKYKFLQSIKEKKELLAYEILKSNTYWDFILPSASEFQCAFLTVSDLVQEEIKDSFYEGIRHEKLKNIEKLADSEYVEKLEERFSYQYPHQELETLYTKTTVSELKMAAMAEKDEVTHSIFEEREWEPYLPRFMQSEKKVSGTTRGSAMHRMMELIDFLDFKTDMDWIQRFIDDKVTSGVLKEEYGRIIQKEKIKKFLESPLAKRMEQAERVGELYKEQPFVYGMSANRLGKEYPKEETVLIQGIIDVFFEEDGELVLMDYKTDAVTNIEDLKIRYETQLDYYQEALEQLTGKRVKERILYSFYFNDQIIV